MSVEPCVDTPGDLSVRNSVVTISSDYHATMVYHGSQTTVCAGLLLNIASDHDDDQLLLYLPTTCHGFGAALMP